MKKTVEIESRIKWAIISCCSFLFLVIFYHHIHKYLSGIFFWLLTLLIPTTFIAILILTFKSIILIVKKRKELSLKIFVPFFVCFLTLIYLFFSSYRFDSENLESEIEFRACFEGTQNQAIIKFRKDKSFEINWTGAFFYDEWWKGKWAKNGDTIYLKYDENKFEQLGEKIIIRNGYLIPIKGKMDTIKNPYPMFYVGICRHEN
ncbi:hypothetical protein KIH23_13565 [Flavobacterium sp. CYK-55]|uniref:hypothetical protein n=1 Tax=Flavobacterium sp. CYK-55 TaxID=2835529 RepID=UPI001BD0B1BA|nr:hypothetical protein [Flavobacterium sp. CYK-55]MBS7788329.1 hypothetical protein [Flavobacterium sp. CYK-55]